MTKDFMLDQAIPNDAAGELGPNWAELLHVPNSASIQQVRELLNLFEYTTTNNLDISTMKKEDLAALKTKYLPSH